MSCYVYGNLYTLPWSHFKRSSTGYTWHMLSPVALKVCEKMFSHTMFYVVFMSLWPRSIRILISNWPRRGGRGRPFLSMVTHWSRSTSSFYALIGQNLTGEFMRKLYATSWKLFSLTAEADRVLCQLLIFLTVFFLWMYKMKYSCYQESSVIHGWFVYWVFGWETRRLSKFGNSISDGIVFVFHLA